MWVSVRNLGPKIGEKKKTCFFLFERLCVYLTVSQRKRGRSRETGGTMSAVGWA